MENLMAQVIQQMKSTASGDAPKEEFVALRRHTFHNSEDQKDAAVTYGRSNRTSSFSMLRSNVLRYVENGGWSAQPLQKTICEPISSRATKNAKKALGRTNLEKHATSDSGNTIETSPMKSSSQPLTCAPEVHVVPQVTNEPHCEDFQLLPLSNSKNSDSNGKREDTEGICETKHPGSCGSLSDKNDSSESIVIHKSPGVESTVYSLECSTDSEYASYDYTSDATNDFSVSAEENSHSESNSDKYSSTATSKTSTTTVFSPNERMEEASGNDVDFFNDATDGCILKGNDINIRSSIDSEGLSTYTLHPRWKEILPKDVIHRILRDDSNNHHFFLNLNDPSISIGSQQHLTDRDFSSSGKANHIMNCISVPNGTTEYKSELCWDTSSKMAEGSDNSYVNEARCVKRASHSTSSCEGSSRSVHEPSQKFNSIQDAYRSILNTIKKASDETIPHLGKRARRSRKTKKKAKPRPVYTCPKCNSSYLVSSKKAIAISRCLQCDLWTSVNDAESVEEEVSVSFCCLS